MRELLGAVTDFVKAAKGTVAVRVRRAGFRTRIAAGTGALLAAVVVVAGLWATGSADRSDSEQADGAQAPDEPSATEPPGDALSETADDADSASSATSEPSDGTDLNGNGGADEPGGSDGEDESTTPRPSAESSPADETPGGDRSAPEATPDGSSTPGDPGTTTTAPAGPTPTPPSETTTSTTQPEEEDEARGGLLDGLLGSLRGTVDHLL